MRPMLARRTPLLLGLGLSAILAWHITHLISAYWAYFEMSTAGGRGMALRYAVLPVTLIAFVAVTLVVHRWASRRGIRIVGELVRIVGALLITYVILLSLEVLRTRGYPSETGAPVRVMEFFRHYLS